MKTRLLIIAIAVNLITSFGMLLRAEVSANRPAGVPDEYVITPFGYFHPSCVLHLAQGETLLADGRTLRRANGTLENVSACNYPHYAASGEIVAAGATKVQSPTINGWVESASVTTSTSYGKIIATWTVPQAPTSNDSQTVFFFPGMEDADDVVSITQPVLQYGSSAAGGGNYWAIASWNCCPSGIVDSSSLVSVNPGDTIQGTVKSTCGAGTESCSTWDITAEDITLGKSTELANTPSEGQTFNWAFGGVLEAYNIARCSDYPANPTLSFSNIALYDYNFDLISNPAWSVTLASGDTPQCSYNVQTAATQVTLDYGTGNSGLGMAAGTSPSIAALTNGNWEAAFQANTTALWVYSTASGGTSTGLGMKTGTSPSIAALTNGDWEVAFQANTTALWLYSTASGGTNIGLGMAAGTSPSIAGLTNGEWEVAFQANTGTLWVYNSASGATNTGLGMKAGTSPSITKLGSGEWEVAFQANTGVLWTYSSSGGATNTGLGMKAGTSPSITKLANGDWETAFQANTTALWTYGNSNGATNTGLGMLAGTSPSITGLTNGDWEVAFQANTGVLWTYGNSTGGSDTGLGMLAGTSPGIAGLTNGDWEVAFQANTSDLWVY